MPRRPEGPRLVLPESQMTEYSHTASAVTQVVQCECYPINTDQGTLSTETNLALEERPFYEGGWQGTHNLRQQQNINDVVLYKRKYY